MAVYTPLDYLIGLVILALIIYITKKFVLKEVEFDKYFLISLTPPIIFAITVRLLADSGFYPKSELWSVTPGIYVLGFFYGALLLALGITVQKRWEIPYWKTILFLGAATIPYFLFNLILKMTAPERFFIPLGIASLLSLTVYLIGKNISQFNFLAANGNILIIFAHFFDASGTFIGIDYFHFSEEHPLPEFFIALTGTAAVMIPLKLLIVGLALYLLEKWHEEEGNRLYYNIIKVTMFILGVGPGTRNSLLLTLTP